MDTIQFIKHYPFLHAALMMPGLFPEYQQISSTVVFSETCRYEHEDNDQWDWNKLIGLKASIDTKQESVMIAWRYHPEKEEIELAPYFHFTGAHQNEGLTKVGTNTAHTYLKPVATTKIDEPINISIQAKPKSYELVIGDWKATFNHSADVEKWIRINPYFGGNKKPPHEMTLEFRNLEVR